MVRVSPLAAMLPLAAAYPRAMQMDQIVKSNVIKRDDAPKTDSRLNTGALHPAPPFSEDQLVRVDAASGHDWQAPQCPRDHRGQCPGLNAAANHGYLPRNGLPTLLETITGLGEAYNMGADLAGALAAISILGSGDIPTLTWSIGGEFPASDAAKALGLTDPSGILGTHDRYEGDASIVRGDAYLRDGNVDYFEFRSWDRLYSLVKGNLTLADVSYHSNYVTEYSVENNPYYFSGPFSGLVAPAAHNFVVNFFSNHSIEQPGGYLDEETLKTFFAVTGEPGSFVWHQYQERIPDNWYKRPGGLNEYGNADVFADLLADAALYPGILKVGGNTGTVNSFAGVDLGNFTQGVYNSADLTDPKKLSCFFFQAESQAQVDELNGLVADVGALTAPLLKYLPVDGCPVLQKPFEFQAFELFPGFNYTAPSPESCPPQVTYENGEPDTTTTPAPTSEPTKEPTKEPTSTWTGKETATEPYTEEKPTKTPYSES